MEIVLTKGMVAIVDDDHGPTLCEMGRWHCRQCRKCSYAVRKVSNRALYMHHAVLQLAGIDRGELFVDHINLNGLDNRRGNLRLCSRTENQGNQRLPAHNKSGYKGVCFDTSRGLWYASCNNKHLGRYTTIEDAALAYDAHARNLWGVFARLNFPRDGELSVFL